jgi:hypothetical protein
MADDFNPYSSPQSSGQLNPFQDEGGGLKNLGQEARKSSLNKARWIMIIIGILTLGINIWGLSYIDDQVKAAQRQGMIVDQSLVTQLKVVTYIAIGMGAALIIMGILVHQFPVPFTIAGLALYLIGQAIGAVYNPAMLVNPIAWVIRIAIIVGLWQSIQAAQAYERERRMSPYNRF